MPPSLSQPPMMALQSPFPVCWSGPATCTDGIQNQGEIGVDCGGPCGPCSMLAFARTMFGSFGGGAQYACGAVRKRCGPKAAIGFKDFELCCPFLRLFSQYPPPPPRTWTPGFSVLPRTVARTVGSPNHNPEIGDIRHPGCFDVRAAPFHSTLIHQLQPPLVNGS